MFATKASVACTSHLVLMSCVRARARACVGGRCMSVHGVQNIVTRSVTSTRSKGLKVGISHCEEVGNSIRMEV